MSQRFVVLSGCSGGGKSTLLRALASRGYGTVPEPGRRIVEAALRGEGGPFPWIDLAGFARRAMALAIADRTEAARAVGWVFFDRGLVDAALAFDHAAGTASAAVLAAEHGYHRRVFLTPPWPEIYVRDASRPHGFAEAVAEYERLAEAYPRLGYEVIPVPKAPVESRAAFILDLLGPALG